jgi:hypothetical protein
MNCSKRRKIINRTEYFKKQKELSKTVVRAETESIRRIRKVTRELVIPLVRQYAEQGMITFPKEELARQIDHIIREEGAKPVLEARKLQEEMEASLAEKLGIKIRPRTEPKENAKQKRLNAARRPIGEIIVLPGQGWGYGVSTKGLAGYYRDSQTGKIVWTDLPLEYQFRKRSDLSTQVWKAAEEQEQMVFDVIQGGRAAGRNVKDVCGDLEQFINYPDGGKRVVGRWMGMFPNTEEGRKEAWKREYLAAHGGLQPGSDAAKALLRQPDAQSWVKQKMDETTQRGTPRLPAAVKQYATRLGKAGLDYRQIRIARTETASMLADEQTEIAENSLISTGEMDFVMERGRDHWNCSCEHYAEQNPWKVDDPDRPEIPVHPNCMCQWIPRLRTDDEIIAAFKEDMAQDLETIEGTQEQAGRLAEIDTRINLLSDNPYNDGIYEYLKNGGEYSGSDYERAIIKIHSMLEPEATKWHKKLSDDYGISRYAEDEFENMNLYLLGKRDDEELLSVEADPEDIRYKIESASQALKKYKLDNDIITWKATKLKHYANYEIGEIFPYPAFHSSSVGFDKATNARDKDLIIQFRIPSGTQGAFIGNNVGIEHEDEFTIQKGLNYQVIERGKIMHQEIEKHLLVLQIVD